MRATTLAYKHSRDAIEVGERITFLRALLDKHYEPGGQPSSLVQSIIDELDDLIALVMHERLAEWECSSVGIADLRYGMPNQRSKTGGTS